MPKKTTVLIVLDGWGIGESSDINPVYVVRPKTFEWLAEHYPVTSLQASGIAVGLPWGEVGNSEVGHLTLGAGKVLYQYFPKITMAIRDGSLAKSEALTNAFAHAIQNNGAVNFVGLLSNGNVHASIEHLHALIKMAEAAKVPKINLHLFADAKDSPPKMLGKFLEEIPREYLASLVGRYYGMDRNGNWKATETAYGAVTGQAGTVTNDPAPLMDATYAKGATEEYLPPMRFSDEKKLTDGDALVFFNYREDSMRQIASAFILPGFDKFPVLTFSNLYIATMTHYDDAFTVPVICPADAVNMPLGKAVSDAGLSQLRIAETYKYAHVTYFFNGLHEAPYPGEYRTLVPSIASPHPEEHPEMRAAAVSDRLIEAIESRGFDFILVNYANADTIAHTANYAASIEAVKTIDRELARVLKAATNPALASDISILITADHGNVEELVNPDTGLPESQHDPNPVPVYLVGNAFAGRKFVNANNLRGETLGSLADVAPTILALMGVPKPEEMNGQSLLDGLV